MDWGPYGEAHMQPFSATDVSTGERAPTCPVEEEDPEQRPEGQILS